jgi:long-subunit acyl-CoA synthetase (AMP-forming)
LADVGAAIIGGRPAGIYTTSSTEQCRYIAGHSASRVLFASAAQIDKFVQVRAALPDVVAVVQLDGEVTAPDVLSWSAFLARGKDVTEGALEARLRAPQASDVCTLIYTSGTTGQPKAVMITHENLTWSAESIQRVLSFTHEERSVSYLPLSHVAEQILTIHGPMALGSCVTFAPAVDAVLDILKEVRPTYFMGVPRVWEKIEAKMKAALTTAPWYRKQLFAWATGVGLRAGAARESGDPVPASARVAERLIYAKVRERLGLDACRVTVSSAAPISRETLLFFRSVGIDVVEVYGMSECSGATTLSTPTRHRLGKVGFAIPGAEVKIAPDGEICMRGKHVFAGYFKDEAATRAALDAEGWLHSGDIGTLDADGFLQITDRKKDLLITAGGENIAPQMLEGLLKAIAGISQVVVVGDRRRYLAALVTLDAERFASEAAAAGSPAKTPAEAAACPQFHAHIMRQVEEVNRSLARVQTIKRVTILARDFSIEGGELTPTMKVKRNVVNEKYKAEIEAMYADA